MLAKCLSSPGGFDRFKVMVETDGPRGRIGCPVVGIVASAGGLDAFKRFFRAMPADGGMTFVLIPHLDPTHESSMVGLLGKLTRMPVMEAQQNLEIEKNQVYVIPPNKFLAISGGRLQLSEPSLQTGWQTSIDFFLRSLAQDQAERAIGIVFSGTGSHGALGIREIKLAGGLTLAQQPDTAEYDQMPQSAIGTGQIDWVLPPEKMPAALVKYIEQPYLHGSVAPTQSSADSGDLLQEILAFLESQTKYDFRSYRKAMLLRRIQRRMSLAGLDSLADYLELLHQRPTEATSLYKDLLISVTAFFRDSAAYHVLEQEVIPALLSRHVDHSPIRIWVPGCATGEEAYSIAILVLEGMARQADGQSVADMECSPEAESSEPTYPTRIQIFASDIDDDAISVARTGIYPASVVSDVSPERLQRFFTPIDDSHYRIGKQVRELIVFSHQNLISDAPFSNLDLISCRNLLIYLEPPLQQKVIELLHFALAPFGYLFLGPAETIGRTVNLFENLSKKWRLFRKIGPTRRDLIGLPVFKAYHRHVPPPFNSPSGLTRERLKDLTERLVLNEYAPAAALINRNYEILYLTGPLVNFLEFPPGELTRDLLAMARAGLRTKLRLTCRAAIRERRTVAELHGRVKRNGHYIACSLTVRPLTEPPEAVGLLLVTFQDRSIERLDDPNGDSLSIVASQGEDSPLIVQLESELNALGEHLNTTIEEMEASTEELKTSNEEIMSVNEELQSANEELETSKEELQALNEELSTVNGQLQDKVLELNQARDDLINLMSSTEIPTLFLDMSLNIKRFTPPAATLLNLRSTDIGRPLGEIKPNFVDEQMLNECQQVLETLTPSEREVFTNDSHCFARRILPYRGLDHHLGGVVITFIDLTERKQAEAAQRQKDASFIATLHEHQERLAAILDTAADAIITITESGAIDSVNRATEHLFGYGRSELVGKTFSILLAPLNSRKSKTSLEEFPDAFIAKHLGSTNETLAVRRDGSIFPIEMTFGVVDHLGLFTGIVRNISERKELQSHILAIASEEQRRIGQELHDGTQQELTGLCLLGGGLCEVLDTAVPTPADEGRTWTLPAQAISGLKQTAEKLLSGLKLANQHVHKLSHGIMPVQIDSEGLRSALAELAASTNQLGQVCCQLRTVGTNCIPNNSAATQLYRIAQESLNNAIRHGRASEITILLSQQEDQIILEVRDNGIGLDPTLRREKQASGRGLGLRIMEYRASLLGGILQIERNHDKGMTIRCLIPITKELT